MSQTTGEPWLIRHQPHPDATLHLFGLPYAGSSATIYRSWGLSGILPAMVEVVAVELPGHGTRQQEPLLDDFATLVDQLTTVLHACIDRPFVLFGHSLGALISFEVARHLWSKYRQAPRHLFVSACHAPQLPDDCPAITDTSSLLDYLRSLGGVPNETMIVRRSALFQADFALRKSYHYYDDGGAMLPSPITAFRGESDDSVTAEALAAWEMHTPRFSQVVVPGNHFFLHTAQRELLQLIEQALQVTV